MKKVFEPAPILIAALVAAVAFYFLLRHKIDPQEVSNGQLVGIGATTGALVQIAVRITGVS